MIKLRSFILIFIVLLFLGCKAKIVVDKLHKVDKVNPAPQAKGMIYALPNTVVRIQMKIDKVTREGAPFSDFAPIFVPGADVVCQEKTAAQILADVIINAESRSKTNKQALADVRAKLPIDSKAVTKAQEQLQSDQASDAKEIADALAKSKADLQSNLQKLNEAQARVENDNDALQKLQAQVPVNPQSVEEAQDKLHVDKQVLIYAQTKYQNANQDLQNAQTNAAAFSQAKAKNDASLKIVRCGIDKFSAQPGATFSTYGEPDPDNVFLVKWVGKGAIDQSLSMTWNEAGVLTAANATVTNRTGDVILSTAKMIAGLGTKAAYGFNQDKPGNTACRISDTADNDSMDKWIIPILAKAGEAIKETLIANYCEMKIEDRKKLPRDEELLKAAIKTYESKIYRLSSGRDTILSGISPTSDPIGLLTRIESEIALEAAKYFLGTKKNVTWDGMIDLRNLPKKNDLSTGDQAKDIAVIRLNPSKGFCLGEAEVPYLSKPYPKEFKNNILTGQDCLSADAKAVNLNIRYFPKMEGQVFSRVTDISDNELSFRYRIPAQVKADLNFDGDTLGSSLFYVGQLGTTIALPANRHSKSLTYDLAFIEQTGGLKTFKLGSTGILDTATVDALSGIGGTLIDAHNKTNELNQLTRQNQILKLQDEICTIQKKYGLPCTVQPQ